MNIVKVDVSPGFVDDLLYGIKRGNTPHGKGRGKPGCNWKRRNYLKTVKDFLESEDKVALVLLEVDDLPAYVSSGFMECIRRHEIRGVKACTRNHLVYLVRTED